MYAFLWVPVFENGNNYSIALCIYSKSYSASLSFEAINSMNDFYSMKLFLLTSNVGIISYYIVSFKSYIYSFLS